MHSIFTHLIRDTVSELLMLALGLAAALALAVLVVYWFSLCSSPTVSRRLFARRKIVYRIVRGRDSTVAKEQRLFTRRARSLWRKEMAGWDTFRITFHASVAYAVFGIVVPDDFDVDSDCLQELGFTLGFLDKIADAALVEFPMRICYARKLNQIRSRAAFYRYFRANDGLMQKPVSAEFRNKKERRVLFVRPVAEHTGLWTQPADE
jgi:hypothetical protein